MSTDIIKGLSQREANLRLSQFGYNELPTDKSKNVWQLIIGIVAEPMIGLLLACGLIYLFLGDKVEAVVLMSSVVFVMILTLYQERKSEKSLEALRNLSSPRALVVRGGKEHRIAGREVVPGDILVLNEGDRVPADAVVIDGTNFKVDESHITGESVAVDKFSVSLADAKSRIYSGSLVVKGHALAEVEHTGRESHIGKIGQSLSSLNIEKTLLQHEVGRFVKYIALLGILLSLVLVVVYYLTRGDLLTGFLAGLTLAIGILPEEMPIVLILFITMGAWRLAKTNVLARRAATIETLGAATVLCVDKTGTLTKNKMEIEAIYLEAPIDIREKSYALDEITYYAMLACQPKPFDPMELAFFNARNKVFDDLGKVYRGLELKLEIPLEKHSLAMINVWKAKKGQKYEVAAKGAPEAIFELCQMEKSETVKNMKLVNQMAESGLRVLAIASGEYLNEDLPTDRHKYDLRFIGLVGLADPVRPEVAASVRTCFDAGIRVVMITGDYATTAQHIAASIGLGSPGGVVTGEQIDKMSDSQLAKSVRKVNIYSRVLPEHKLRIVEALKKNGEVVAMTGDGVNDAPALKSAHIGVAMGERGTDVAREAAAIVLLDDDFSSIVNGVKIGRRIYSNLQKAMRYIFSIHVPIAGLSLLPVFFGMPLVLMPIHIVFMELLIDPTCTIVFESEPEESGIMNRPPRKVKGHIFNKNMILTSVVEGAIILLITMLSYKYLLDIGWPIDKARGFTFLTLIVSNILIVLSNRSETDYAIKRLIDGKNKPFYLISIMAILVMAAVFLVPGLSVLFRFGALSGVEVLAAMSLGFLSLGWLEMLKAFRQK